jgi:DNA-binding beta-propeller fold protein YncE
MNKKLTAIFSLVIILAFMGYIIYDASTGSGKSDNPVISSDTTYEDSWSVDRTYHVSEGELSSVAVSPDGMIFLGGDSFVKAVTNDLNEVWNLETEEKITALSLSGDTLFASTTETILLVSASGKLINEWGPYEGNSMITSISTSGKNVAFADAGNKRIFILDKKGEVQMMIGQADEKFVIPSPYFDAALSDNLMFVVNTGNRRIETWGLNGRKITEFGEPGTAPGAFCGCCNPAHFAVIPQGFVTAEKGINRIKILDRNGEFVEFVSSQNDFVESIPLDVASVDGKTIYAANSVDSTLYIFKHK